MTDILELVIPYAAGILECPVASEMPEKAPKAIVVFRRTGGRGDRFVDRPRVLAHCWGGTDEEAASLAYAVAGLMLESPDKLANVTRCLQDSIYQNDLDGRHRWSVSFDMVVNR